MPRRSAPAATRSRLSSVWLLVWLTVAVALVDPGQGTVTSWTTILNTTELVQREGYKCEHHTVEASDGFRLAVFRIPGSGTPIFVMHGLFVASDSWVVRGKGKDLVFLLADLGYDVWMGDARGNYYSRSHNTFTPSDNVFWDFSVEEMGALDLPAAIDHILATSGHSSLVYIGHSLGTTMLYVMSARRPEYIHKVRLMVGLAPAAFFGRYRAAFLRFLLESSNNYSEYFGRVGVHEVMPRNPLMGMTARVFCSPTSPTQRLCLQFLYFVAGLGSLSDFSHINKTLLPEFACHVPAGSSPKTLAHLGQLSKTGRFTGYDYGPEENMQRYKKASPPEIDLSKTSMPVLNFYGEGDNLVDARDVADLSDRLPQLLGNVAADNPLFNHMDFIWAEDSRRVYDRVIETIAKYDD